MLIGDIQAVRELELELFAESLRKRSASGILKHGYAIQVLEFIIDAYEALEPALHTRETIIAIGANGEYRRAVGRMAAK